MTTNTTMQKPRVMRRIPADQLSPPNLDVLIQRRKKAEERWQEDMAAWTYRACKARPFLRTQLRLAEKKAIVEAGKTTRKQRKEIRFQTAVKIAKQYRGKRF